MKTPADSVRLIPLFLAALAAFGCSSQQAEPVAPEPPPAEEPEPVAVAPGPSPQDIKQAVDSKTAALTDCYLVGTFKDSQLAGTVKVNFTIEPTGKVSSASDAGSDMPDPEVVECVVDVFADLQFTPGGAGSTDVTYPVSFGTRG